MAIALTLLGGFSLKDRNGEPIAVTRTKARALLCYLALNGPQEQSRQRLCDLLWTRHDRTSAGNCLRQIVSHLRRAIPDNDRYLAFGRDSLALRNRHWTTDVWQLHAADRSRCPAEKQQAFDCYRGELLAGYDVPEDGFDEWLLLERRKVEQVAIALGCDLLETYATRRSNSALVRQAYAMIGLDPYCEDYYRLAMRGLVGLGRRREADGLFHALRRKLNDELDEAPAPETVRLHRGLDRLPTDGHTANGNGARKAAIEHLHSAARLLSEQGAHAIAADTYGNALRLQAEPGSRNGRSANLLLGHYRETFLLGDYPAAGHSADLALQHAADGGPAERTRAELAVANCRRMSGKLAEALVHGRNAIILASRVDGSEGAKLLVRANLSVGTTHFLLGNYGAAFPLLNDNIAGLAHVAMSEGDEAEPGLPLLRSYGWYVWCCSELGRFELGERIAAEAFRLAEEFDDHYSLNNCRVALGVLLLHKGEYSQAADVLTEADEAIRTAEIGGLVPMVRMPMAMCLAETGRLAEAGAIIESVAQWPDLPIVKAGLAMIGVLRGAPETAADLARRGVAQARTIGAKGDEGWNFLSLAGALTNLGEHGHSREALDMASGIANDLGMKPLAAFCGLRRTIASKGGMPETRSVANPRLHH